MEAEWHGRVLLSSQGVSIQFPGVTSHSDSGNGFGRQCEKAAGNTTADLFNTTWYSLNCISTYTVDSQIWLTMMSTAVVGLICLAVFCWGQSFVSVYRGRLLSPHVALKPPVFSARSFYSKYISWLCVTMSLSENEILATAGMDALMFERLIVFGLQFMAPVTVIAMCTLIPIHTASTYPSTQSAQQLASTNLMTLTMGTLKPGARILWVHFVLVILFTCYGMWLLDQHYKSYVLLRQQYLTRGDSVSTWLGKTPKQRLHASHGSMLAPDLHAGEDFSQPMWTFARAKVSDSDSSGLHPGTSSAAARPAPADGATTHASHQPSAATASSLPDAQQGAALSELETMRAAGSADSPSRQGSQQGRQSRQLQAHALADLEEHPAPRAAAAVSPFSLQQGDEALQQRDTLQMVQLTDVVFSVPNEGRQSLAGQSVVRSQPQQHAVASGAAAGLDPASPSELSSTAGSTLVSRQSSARALLASKHTDSSPTEPVHSHGPQHPAVFSIMQPFRRHSKEQGLQAQPFQESTASSFAEGVDLDSAAGAVSQAGANRKARRRLTGCGGCTWGRLSCGSSEDGNAASGACVSFAPDAAEQQHTEAQRLAEAEAAAEAAEQLGADVNWWDWKSHDILLDRHVARVDLNKELDEDEASGQPSSRPYFWWELVPSDPSSLSGSGGSSAAGPGSSSNIQPVPGTSLLFDRRSLRTRRPSVRFRNTVHVRAHDGSLVPLHVSNYAVLVTDVPEPGRVRRTSSSCDTDLTVGRVCWQPFQEFFAAMLGVVETCLQFLVWAWPCLLSRKQLMQHAKDWGHASLKSTLSMTMVDGSQDLCDLEEGELLAGCVQQDLQQASRRQQLQHQRQAAFQSRAFDRPCFDRRRLVELTFRHLFPGDVQAVIPAQEYKALNELLREWNRKVQAYMFTAGLLDLKKQKQEHKKQQEAQKAEAARQPGVAAAAEQQQGPANQQVCIDVSSIQGKVAAKAALEATQASAASGQLTSGVYDAADVAHSSSRSSSAAAGMAANGCEPAAQHPSMARSSSGCSSDADSDDELGCCAEMSRRLCCCPCCFMGAIQDDDSRLLQPRQDQPGATRGWCCGLFGRRSQVQDPTQQVSSSSLKEKRREILELEKKILQAQKEVRASPDTGNFIVLFKSPRAANLAANTTVYPHEGSVEAFKVQPAPNPEDVLWPSLWASPADRRAVLWKCVFWYTVLFSVPTGFFAAALNGVSLTMCSSSDFGRSFKWFCDSTFLQFIFTIVLPFVLLMLWQNAVIPGQLYRLELRRAVAVSLSQMERRILLTYCSWELTNIFMGGVLSGSLLTQVQTFVKHPEKWAEILGAAIPQTSNFFLSYVITRAFMMNFVRLLMPHGGMWRWLGQMLFTGFTSFRHAATAAYRARIIYPASIRYGREPGLVLLILLIGMAYCVAAPLLTVFVSVYMVTAYIIWRHQIIYVCTRAYESGGRMWPTYFLCITYCLGFFVAFTSSMLIFKKANLQGVLVLLLLPILYIFNRRCRVRYFSKVNRPPLWLSHTAPRSEIDPLVYIPPCMQPSAQGWFFEAGKPWVRWGVPSYNNPKGTGHDDGGCCC